MQFGVEFCGEADPLADVEVIAMAAELLNDLNHCTGTCQTALEINTLGDTTSRKCFQNALLEYLHFCGRKEELSASTFRRLERGGIDTNNFIIR